MFITLWGHLSYFLQDFSFYLILLFLSFIGTIIGLLKIYKSPFSNTIKYTLCGLLFTVFSTIFLFSCFEAYFRYKFDQSDSLGFLKVTGRWYQRHAAFNNYQYRDRNFVAEKTPGVVRIGVMGDSNTFGYGIKNPADRFSDVLEKKLKQHGYKVEVYNFGVAGIGTDEEIKEYHRIQHFNFDILVWQYFLNDIQPPHNNAGTTILNNARTINSPIVMYLSDHSFFFDYLYWRLASRYASTFVQLRDSDIQAYGNKALLDAHTQTITSFSQELQEQNKKFIVLTIPFLYFFPDYPKSAVAIHEKMDTMFTDNGAASVVDLLPYLKGKSKQELVVGQYDSHPNEAVHRFAADKLYDAIVPLIEKTGDGTVMKVAVEEE